MVPGSSGMISLTGYEAREFLVKVLDEDDVGRPRRLATIVLDHQKPLAVRR